MDFNQLHRDDLEVERLEDENERRNAAEAARQALRDPVAAIRTELESRQSNVTGAQLWEEDMEVWYREEDPTSTTGLS